MTSSAGPPAPPLPPELAAALPGRFLVFDGPDGSGKSTQLARFAAACEEAGVPLCRTREPGGTPIGESLRELLLAERDDPLTARAEMLLFMASRAELVEKVVRPALADRRLVLADRFVSSTLAYQGAAGGVPLDDIRRVAEAACGGTRPDLTVIFDVPPEVAAQRLGGAAAPRGRHQRAAADTGILFADGMESRGEAHRAAVRRGYLEQVAAEPDRHRTVDASGSEDDVFGATVAAIAEALPRPESR